MKKRYLLPQNGGPHLVKVPSTFPSKICEELALGLDLGIGSCGQALVSRKSEEKPLLEGLDRFAGRISFLGVRAFDVPETKEQTGAKLKNPERRKHRQLRKTTHRRASRMWAIRLLLKQDGLLPEDYPTERSRWKRTPGQELDPSVKKWSTWHAQMTEGKNGKQGPLELRVKALDTKLEPLEWAAALLHLAKHRGFKSSRKGEAVDEEGGKILKVLKQNRQILEDKKYRTVAEMLLKDPSFKQRKRNRGGEYINMLARGEQEAEIKNLFSRQRELGNPHASLDLEKAFLSRFNQQLPLQNSVKLLGDCAFEKGKKRGSRYAYSFELARALQKLNNFTLLLPEGAKVRLADYVNAAGGGYEAFITAFPTLGNKSAPGRVTWRDLRKIFKLPPEVSFVDIPSPAQKKAKKGTPENAEPVFQSIEELEKEDFLTRKNSNATAKGSHLLWKALGAELWAKYAAKQPEQLDKIAFALSFFEEVENGREEEKFWGVLDQMKAEAIEKELIDLVAKDLHSEKPTLAKFAGSTSISSKASRRLIEPLSHGLLYSEACSQLYGDHRQSDFNFDDITNPVVKSVVLEVLKQVVHLIDQTGKIPGTICVELARDLGKSTKEREKISEGLRKRNTEKNAHREELRKIIGCNPSDDELLRYELYREQAANCPYCMDKLGKPHECLMAGYQIDHILPRSRSHDNSYSNKVLVHTSCNQNKGSQTPFEFSKIGGGKVESPGWRTHLGRIENMKGLGKEKRRKLLNTTFAEEEGKFIARNLKDTQYLSRLVSHYLQKIYELGGEKPLTEKGSTRRVFVQPGALTSLVRKAWGLENLKKDRDGERLGDKHHAVDALVCALLSEGQGQWITRLEQANRDRQAELRELRDLRQNSPDPLAHLTASYAEMERLHQGRSTPLHVRPPWPNFRSDVLAALDAFTVSRRETRKGRGSLHNATLYIVKKEDEKEVCYSRKALIYLDNGKQKARFAKVEELNKVKDIDLERNAWLKQALLDWIEKGSPLDAPPRDSQGCLIRRVTMSQGKKSGRDYPQGYVTGGSQVRLDVFSKTNKQGKKTYHLVPVYSYHLTKENPPLKAIAPNKDEADWTPIDSSYLFEFSLWPNSRFEIRKKPSAKKPAGEHIVGLYTGVDRATGAVSYNHPDDSTKKERCSVKTGTLLFQKLETDRLGRVFDLTNQKRTWRGNIIELKD